MFSCRVNKRWNAVLKHCSLWKQVKVRCSKKNTAKFRSTLVKFMKSRFTTLLVHLDISLMNVAGLKFLDKNCVNLQSLVLRLENGKINLLQIPNRETLKSLEIKTAERGGASRGWWQDLTRENFPHIDHLGIDVSNIPVAQFLEYYISDSSRLERLLRNHISTFVGLRHLKLSLDWEYIKPDEIFHPDCLFIYLHYVVLQLESLHLDYSKYCRTPSLPEHLYAFLGVAHLDNLKTLKLPFWPNNKPESLNTQLLQSLSNLPKLESLHILSNVSMKCLKAGLPRFTKLKDLYVVNVDKKLESQKHRLNWAVKMDVWKSIVDEVGSFCPHLHLHLIDCPFRTVRCHKGCKLRGKILECKFHFQKDYQLQTNN